jgi:hypothetical protein
LAKLVSYGVDKKRLQERARLLRQQAQELLGEDRSWDQMPRRRFGG